MKIACAAASVALLALSQPLTAQSIRRCGFDEAVARDLAAHPQQEAAYWQAREAMLLQATENAATAQRTTGSSPIPVMFHIVITSSQLSQIGGAAGVSARVDSSIAVLNRDYGGTNADQASIPAVFKPVFGTSALQFGRATKSPAGEYTPGYEILTTAASGITADYDASSPGSQDYCAAVKYTPAEGGKGFAAWDPTRYLNVWVCNITSGGSFTILGIAAPPSLRKSNFPREQGVVINYGAFGKRSTTSSAGFYIQGIDGGRTLVHEIGHYFELYHVFGTNGKCPGAGDIDDGIADTPPQDTLDYGCFTSPPANTCSSMGRMYPNYLDYSDDACLLMFTKQQVAVMNAQVVSGANSYTLTQNAPLTAVANATVATVDFEAWPNPAVDVLHLEWPATATAAPRDLVLLDVTGRTVKTAGNLAGQSSYQLDLSRLPRGLYTVRATFAAGTATRKVVLQ